MQDFEYVSTQELNKVQKKGKRGRKPGIKPNKARVADTLKSSEVEKTPEVKKGKKVKFRPASKLGHFDAPDGFVGRWVNASDVGNVMRKQIEGWEFVNATTVPGYKQYNEIVKGKEVTESNGLGGSLRHNDMVAMILPQEIKESRDEYYRNLTNAQTNARIDSVEQKNKLGGHGQNIYGNTLTID